MIVECLERRRRTGSVNLFSTIKSSAQAHHSAMVGECLERRRTGRANSFSTIKSPAQA
jgi:hypothetical protein